MYKEIVDFLFVCTAGLIPQNLTGLLAAKSKQNNSREMNEESKDDFFFITNGKKNFNIFKNYYRNEKKCFHTTHLKH